MLTCGCTLPLPEGLVHARNGVMHTPCGSVGKEVSWKNEDEKNFSMLVRADKCCYGVM